MPDNSLRYGELRFVWDEDKNRKNIKKHGISFSIAAKVFDDALRLEYRMLNTVRMKNDI